MYNEGLLGEGRLFTFPPVKRPEEDYRTSHSQGFNTVSTYFNKFHKGLPPTSNFPPPAEPATFKY